MMHASEIESLQCLHSSPRVIRSDATYLLSRTLTTTHRAHNHIIHKTYRPRLEAVLPILPRRGSSIRKRSRNISSQVNAKETANTQSLQATRSGIAGVWIDL